MRQTIIAKYKGEDGKEYESPIATVENDSEYLAVVEFFGILERLRKDKQ